MNKRRSRSLRRLYSQIKMGQTIWLLTFDLLLLLLYNNLWGLMKWTNKQSNVEGNNGSKISFKEKPKHSVCIHFHPDQSIL